MFISEDENSRRIRELFASTNDREPLRCAVAFLGEAAFDYFEHGSGQQVMLICNLESGATNPNVVRKLLGSRMKKRVSIRTLAKLHAKVYCGRKSAIVGSANLSANGLSLESDELQGWIEASILTTDQDDIRAIKTWFGRKWEQGIPIADTAHPLLEAAFRMWERRRNERPSFTKFSKNRSLLESLIQNPEEFKDRRIFITVNDEDFNEVETQRLEEVKRDSGESDLSAWVDWKPPEFAQFLDFHRNDRSARIIYSGMFATDETRKVPLRSRDKGGSQLYLCRTIRSIFGCRLTREDEKAVKKAIKDSEWRGDCVSLYKARKLLARYVT